MRSLHGLSVILVWSATANATALHLRWAAPENCPREEAFRRMIDAYLGASAVSVLRESISVDGWVQRVGDDQYRLKLRLANDAGERERRLEHSDCWKVADAGALIVAVAIAPDKIRFETPPFVREAPTSDGAETSGHDSPKTESPQRHGVGLALGGYGLLGSGVLPGVAPGFGAELQVEPLSRLRFVVHGDYWFVQEQGLQGTSGASATFSLLSAGALACWQPSGAWQLALCTGSRAGSLKGAGHGLDADRRAQPLWLAHSVDLALGYPLADWTALELRVGAFVALQRPRFDVEGLGDVYRPARWGSIATMSWVVEVLGPATVQ